MDWLGLLEDLQDDLRNHIAQDSLLGLDELTMWYEAITEALAYLQRDTPTDEEYALMKERAYEHP